MEFITLEMLEKWLGMKEIITASIIFFIVEKRVEKKAVVWIEPFKKEIKAHAISVQESLSNINGNIGELKDSIVNLEKTQTKKINELGDRVTKLEEKK